MSGHQHLPPKENQCLRSEEITKNDPQFRTHLTSDLISSPKLNRIGAAKENEPFLPSIRNFRRFVTFPLR